MQIISVANRKGGVGKSTCTVNLAAALGLRGYRVLVIDMDSQASATATLLVDLADDALTMAHVLIGHCTLPEILQASTSPNVWIAPANKDLTGAQLTLATKPGRETVLKRAMRALQGFDVVLLDTAPEQQLATVNAFVAATHVLMPFTPDPKALEGLATTTDAVQEIVAAELSNVSVLGCVQMAFDKRIGVTQDARDQVKEAYGDLLLETTVRQNSNFIPCPAWHRDIFQHEKAEKSGKKGSEDFAALAAEVIARLSLPAVRKTAAA